MIIVYSTYSSELFRESQKSKNKNAFFCSAYSSELFPADFSHVKRSFWLLLRLLFWVVSSCRHQCNYLLWTSAPLTLLSCFNTNSNDRSSAVTSAPLTLLSCFGKTAHFFKVQLAKKTQLLWMHSYYMSYSCINCQILLHRIILTCSFSSANPTAILWVLNVRTPW